jgi:hypothetical protein
MLAAAKYIGAGVACSGFIYPGFIYTYFTNINLHQFKVGILSDWLTYPYHYNKAFAFLNFLYPLTVILLHS